MKKPDLNTKAGKYFLAKRSGKNKKDAAVIAGYAPHPSNVTQIENTKGYQEIEKYYYKDELLKHVTLSEIAAAHADNIKQDDDRGARNKAIEMAMDKLEPSDSAKDDTDQMIVVIQS